MAAIVVAGILAAVVVVVALHVVVAGMNLPVDLQGRLLGKSAEHTHEGDLVREAQPIVGAPSQGDLLSVGLEKGGIAN